MSCRVLLYNIFNIIRSSCLLNNTRARKGRYKYHETIPGNVFKCNAKGWFRSNENCFLTLRLLSSVITQEICRKTKGNVSYLMRTFANKNAFFTFFWKYSRLTPSSSTFPSSLPALGRTRFNIFPRFAAGYTSSYTWRPITGRSHDYITCEPELYEQPVMRFPALCCQRQWFTKWRRKHFLQLLQTSRRP